MNRLLVTAALWAAILASQPAWARLHGEIVEFGETTSEPSAPSRPDAGTLSPIVPLKDIRFISHADRLVAARCLRFGVWFRITSDSGERLPQMITAVIRHPRITRPDQVSATEESYLTGVNGGMAYIGYTFGEAWEMQPGDWTLAFTYDGELLASKTFAITVPTPPSSVCEVPTS